MCRDEMDFGGIRIRGEREEEEVVVVVVITRLGIGVRDRNERRADVTSMTGYDQPGRYANVWYKRVVEAAPVTIKDEKV